ncbi:hypothetical protein Mpop_0722 [Methylorubrum populi BJ001]|jgi:hypothetical protein|uniref:DUF4384 domain-containing protein n=1 Tax=Methylorubrum populi (strain ATCC BAA-705 / NCIMB 13946 / BJ001) TaxID=441620 RepID=B1Z717_METPB|nr:hypothetical protein [Methylorubrum populi]ACB78900.1 hypothetical protein Mpop_0722 [Methylorubrum populi BJ001]OAH32389.1 hypothetical protein AX289_08110 [Methylorubrum populi]
MRRLILAALLLLPAAARADPTTATLAPFLDAVAACAGRPDLTLAVIGVEPGQTALSREQAEEVRLAVESRLQATGRVRLAASADVVRIKALREGTTGLSGAEAEAQIRAAFSGDASVFLVEPRRAGETAALRLQAITRAAACKATSEPLTVPIRVGAAVADLDAVMEGAVKAFAAAAPNAKAVEVCPFVAEGGHSTCAGALTDRLLIALDAEARSANRILKGARLDVRRSPPGTACTGPVTAQGRFLTDQSRQSWMELEFQRDGAVLAPTGRRRIGVEGLGCDPTPRPFLDHLAATARTDAGRLTVAATATPFSAGQRLEMRIEARTQQTLYCWVVAPDETAFVALPVRGNPASAAPLKAGEAKRYPRSYGLDEIVAGESFENLFACFGVEGGLPPDLAERWLAAAPGKDGEARLLQPSDTLDLLEKIRATPGVTEATARIVVR